MHYDVNTPDEYLDALEEDWRKETLLKIRSFIQSGSSNLREGIQYKMLGYFLNDITVFQLTAQKNYVSLYVGDHRKVDPNLTYLKGLNLGKGCIRFSKSIVVEETDINAFIRKAISMAEAGEDIAC